MIRKNGLMKNIASLVLAAVCAAGICGMQVCGETAPASSEAKTETAAAPAEDSPEWVSSLEAAADAKQLFVVAGVGQTTAYVSMHEKNEDGTWKMIMSTPGYIGKKGLGKEKEGDAKTPVGTFGFNRAFGIAEDPGCALDYKQVTEDDYWSGDGRDGYHYNEMVSIKDLPDLNTEDSEHLTDYTNEYQYCLNISYNEEGTPGLGSAIFLHCLGAQRPFTGGCVAIPQDKMITVMQNVDKDCVVVIGPAKTLCPGLYEKWGLASAEEADKAEKSGQKQTASAHLDQNENSITVTVDVSGGWSAYFARGAVYLYDGEYTEDRDAVAMGITLEKEVFDEYIKGAPDHDNYKEIENGVFYTDEDGTAYYFFTVGENAYFMIDVAKGADSDAVYERFHAEPFTG